MTTASSTSTTVSPSRVAAPSTGFSARRLARPHHRLHDPRQQQAMKPLPTGRSNTQHGTASLQRTRLSHVPLPRRYHHSLLYRLASRAGCTRIAYLPSFAGPSSSLARPAREQLPFSSSAYHALLRSTSAHRHSATSSPPRALSHQHRLARQVALTIAALVGYWILMRFVPVTGIRIPGRDIPLSRPRRQLSRAWGRSPHLLRLTPLRAHPRSRRSSQHHTCSGHHAPRTPCRHLVAHTAHLLVAKSVGIAAAGFKRSSSG